MAAQNRRVMLIEPLTSRFFKRNALGPPDNKLGLYALEKLAGELEANGFDTQVMSVRDLSIEQVVIMVQRFNPMLVGFSVLTFNFNLTKRLAHAIKKKLPEVKIVLGGYHISEMPSDIVASTSFDVGVLGYGEEPLTNLARFFTGTSEYERLEDIPGLVLPHHSSRQFRKTPPQELRPVENYAEAKRNWEDIREARCEFMAYPPPDEQISGVAQIATAAGCLFSCTFCSTPTLEEAGYGNLQGKTRVSYRDPVVVAKELQMLRDKGVRLGFLTTATFNDRSDSLEAYCNALIEQGTHSTLPEDHPDHINQSIHLYAFCKVGLTEKQAQLMYRAGISVVATGVESAEPAILRDWKKPYRTDDDFSTVIEHMENWNTAGGLNRALLMFPTPDDSPRSKQRLIGLLKLAKPDCLRISHLSPNFGTPDGMKLRRNGMVLSNNYDEYDHSHILVKTPHFTAEELPDLHLSICVAYYLSEEYREHVKQKLERCPWYVGTFKYLFETLYHNSNRTIDLGYLVHRHT